jgi:beta-lactamase regulating signal transducer with metallopeptidase domain
MFMSLSGSLIALLLFLTRPLVKFKLSQTWQYYIWLAVIARLLVPFTPEVSLMSGLYDLFERTTQIEIDIRDIQADTVAGIVLRYIGIVWFSLSFLLLVKKIISYRAYIRFIEMSRERITDTAILNLQEKVCRELGLKRNLAMYSHKWISSPMLIGFFKPYIILPRILTESTQGLHYIIKHELVHYKRKDFLYKWLIQIMSCIYFWNPVVWLMQNSIYKSCELSCDENVIRGLDSSGKKAYGSALLYAIETSVRYRRASALSLMMCEEAKHITERLNAIRRHKKSGIPILAASLFLTAAICFGSVYVGVIQTICINNNCYCNAAITRTLSEGR